MKPNNCVPHRQNVFVVTALYNVELLFWRGQVGLIAASPRANESGRLVPAVQVAPDRVAPGRVANASKLTRADSASDEDQVPTRGYLKRQTRIIVEAKTKKQNNRPRKGD